MRKLILGALLLLSTISFGQTIERKLIEGNETAGFKQEIINHQDTSVYFFWSYKNMAYQYLSDYTSIIISDTNTLLKFANELINLGSKDEKLDIDVSINNKIRLRLYDFSRNIYIIDEDGKYTTITRKMAISIGVWLKEKYYLIK